jgi:CHAT domain-containing protein
MVIKSASCNMLYVDVHLHLSSQDHTNVLDSGFIMRDDILTVSRLMSLNLPSAFLAVLSACETAKGDEAQPDQTIHLAATMLFCGFKSVVGTMWLVSCSLVSTARS